MHTLQERYTTAELAKAMKVSRQTVSQWRAQGCPCVITGKIAQGKNSRPRFNLSEVETWLKSRTEAAAP